MANHPFTIPADTRARRRRPQPLRSLRPAGFRLPTIAELGFPGYETSSWQGLLAPAGTPREVVAKINAGAVAMINAPELRQRISQKGADPQHARPIWVKSEIAKWAKVIREADIGTSDRVVPMDRCESGCVARVSAQRVHPPLALILQAFSP
jgi:hypothetical protein